MGTNYYKGNIHLGKRSAAGLYCFDCDITLRKGGRDLVHQGGWEQKDLWYADCPVCGGKPVKEDMNTSSVGKELGFNKKSQIQKGIRTCTSFRWAIEPAMLKKIRGSIDNEYGDKFTDKQFQALVKDCPIHYFDSIGQEFC